MRTHSLLAVLAVAIVATSAVASPADADADRRVDRTRVYTLDPSSHGNPEGVAWDAGSETFFVGAVGDGTIYRGRLGDRTITPWLTGAPGIAAVGMKARRGLLYVAGGSFGDVRVYDIARRSLVGSFTTGAGGFLNDLVVTQSGDVWVTDSFRPMLWHLSPALVRAGSGTPESVSVAPEIAFTPGAFNLNGIVALLGGRRLVVVRSVDGALFQIDLGHRAPSQRRIARIAVDPLAGGDGLLLDDGRLIVVQNGPDTLTFVRLRGLRGTIEARLADPTFRGTSTIARARDRYLVVNADFGTSTPPFTVSGLDRDRE